MEVSAVAYEEHSDGTSEHCGVVNDTSWSYAEEGRDVNLGLELVQRVIQGVMRKPLREHLKVPPEDHERIKQLDQWETALKWARDQRKYFRARQGSAEGSVDCLDTLLSMDMEQEEGSHDSWCVRHQPPHSHHPRSAHMQPHGGFGFDAAEGAHPQHSRQPLPAVMAAPTRGGSDPMANNGVSAYGLARARSSHGSGGAPVVHTHKPMPPAASPWLLPPHPEHGHAQPPPQAAAAGAGAGALGSPEGSSGSATAHVARFGPDAHALSDNEADAMIGDDAPYNHPASYNHQPPPHPMPHHPYPTHHLHQQGFTQPGPPPTRPSQQHLQQSPPHLPCNPQTTDHQPPPFAYLPSQPPPDLHPPSQWSPPHNPTHPPPHIPPGQAPGGNADPPLHPHNTGMHCDPSATHPHAHPHPIPHHLPGTTQQQQQQQLAVMDFRQPVPGDRAGSFHALPSLGLGSTGQGTKRSKPDMLELPPGLLDVNAAGGPTFRYRGLTWVAAKSKWRVSIRVNNIKRHIGYFTDAQLAARAFDRANIEIFGAHNAGRLNFPLEEYAPGSASLAQLEADLAAAREARVRPRIQKVPRKRRQPLPGADLTPEDAAAAAMAAAEALLGGHMDVHGGGGFGADPMGVSGGDPDVLYPAFVGYLQQMMGGELDMHGGVSSSKGGAPAISVNDSLIEAVAAAVNMADLDMHQVQQAATTAGNLFRDTARRMSDTSGAVALEAAAAAAAAAVVAAAGRQHSSGGEAGLSDGPVHSMPSMHADHRAGDPHPPSSLHGPQGQQEGSLSLSQGNSQGDIGGTRHTGAHYPPPHAYGGPHGRYGHDGAAVGGAQGGQTSPTQGEGGGAARPAPHAAPQPPAQQGYQGLQKMHGYVGVYWVRKAGLFRVYSSVVEGGQKRKVRVGEFGTLEEAARAYDGFVLSTRGHQTRTNYPIDQYLHLLPAAEAAAAEAAAAAAAEVAAAEAVADGDGQERGDQDLAMHLQEFEDVVPVADALDPDSGHHHNNSQDVPYGHPPHQGQSDSHSQPPQHSHHHHHPQQLAPAGPLGGRNHSRYVAGEVIDGGGGGGDDGGGPRRVMPACPSPFHTPPASSRHQPQHAQYGEELTEAGMGECDVPGLFVGRDSPFPLFFGHTELAALPSGIPPFSPPSPLFPLPSSTFTPLPGDMGGTPRTGVPQGRADFGEGMGLEGRMGDLGDYQGTPHSQPSHHRHQQQHTHMHQPPASPQHGQRQSGGGGSPYPCAAPGSSARSPRAPPAPPVQQHGESAAARAYRQWREGDC